MQSAFFSNLPAVQTQKPISKCYSLLFEFLIFFMLFAQSENRSMFCKNTFNYGCSEIKHQSRIINYPFMTFQVLLIRTTIFFEKGMFGNFRWMEIAYSQHNF